MTQNEDPILNPNSASDEELRQLPGVGPQLAARIIAGRPYQNLKDLRRVPGIGDRVLRAIEPLLTLTPQAAGEPEVPTSGEKGQVADQDRLPEQASTTELKYPLVITEPRAQWSGFRALLAMGLASALCSLTLTLAVMAGINGTLDFQFRSQVDTTQREIDALRGRAEDLDGVSGRMFEVEDQVTSLQQQIDETLTAMGEIQMELASALDETRAQAERVGRFQSFLDGLSRLVGQATTEP